jgi:hypothetical protein
MFTERIADGSPALSAQSEDLIIEFLQAPQLDLPAFLFAR